MKAIHSISQFVFMIGIFILIISWGGYAIAYKKYTPEENKNKKTYLYTLTGVVILAAIGTFGIKES